MQNEEQSFSNKQMTKNYIKSKESIYASFTKRNI